MVNASIEVCIHLKVREKQVRRVAKDMKGKKLAKQ